MKELNEKVWSVPFQKLDSSPSNCLMKHVEFEAFANFPIFLENFILSFLYSDQMLSSLISTTLMQPTHSDSVIINPWFAILFIYNVFEI